MVTVGVFRYAFVLFVVRRSALAFAGKYFSNIKVHSVLSTGSALCVVTLCTGVFECGARGRKVPNVCLAGLCRRGTPQHYSQACAIYECRDCLCATHCDGCVSYRPCTRTDQPVARSFLFQIMFCSMKMSKLFVS
jgi:hypothetical protein